MILFGINRGIWGVASALLMLIAGMTGAGAQAVVHREAAPASVDTGGPETIERDPKTGDTLVKERGVASWYGRAWRGRRTASGMPFDDRAMTAAHVWLPFATRARVTNVQNGRSIDVIVNDRGPHHEGRIIDLSAKAAEELGIKECGTAEVVVSAQF
jgi:rare lipoprotein A